MSNQWVNLITQQTPPYVFNNIQNFPANQEALLANGWRFTDESSIPALQSGYTRVSLRWVQDGSRPTRAVAQVTDRLTSEIEAEQAAAAQAAKDARATLDNSDVLLRAVSAVVIAETELIKTVIRATHSATASTIPAKSAADWIAAIKAKALELIG